RDVCQLFSGIDLVHDEKNSLAGLPQEPGKFLIGSRDSRAAVDNKKDERSMIDRDLSLFDNLSRDLCLVTRNNSPRVDYLKRSSAPVDRSIDAISSNTGFIRDDRTPFADKTIEERRLSDVGPADDCNQAVCCRHALNFAFLLEDSTSNWSRGFSGKL